MQQSTSGYVAIELNADAEMIAADLFSSIIGEDSASERRRRMTNQLAEGSTSTISSASARGLQFLRKFWRALGTLVTMDTHCQTTCATRHIPQSVGRLHLRCRQISSASRHDLIPPLSNPRGIISQTGNRSFGLEQAARVSGGYAR
jgi:hypothetical protein